ncbi:hypothetical protein M0R45_001606 [Rubus argutus]|uniref:Uncharacterized protein n=1 Tax=Rubus argutus TaxID=59490 RepID=A0AAW1VFI2_RUBAR
MRAPTWDGGLGVRHGRGGRHGKERHRDERAGAGGIDRQMGRGMAGLVGEHGGEWKTAAAADLVSSSHGCNAGVVDFSR